MKPLEEKYHTERKRFYARLIDEIFFFIFATSLTFLESLLYKSELISFLLYLVMCFGNLFYFVYFNYKFGQTIGKKILNLKVVNEEDELNLSLAHI